jgi:CubicO group peptidase (beta-lactamase class C family)
MLPPQTPPAVSPPFPSASAITRFVEREAKAVKAPGVSVAVVRFGKIAYEGGVGFANVENSVRADAHTVYRLGSVTKQFTATMIMQLVQEGKLTLSATLGELLPSTPAAWHPVTVRQLLSHTSGIPNSTNVPDFMQMIRRDVTPEHINDDIKDRPLDFPPGTQWSYSNSGFVVLGLIVEKLDGQPYGVSLRRRILDPLGMNETYFVSESEVVRHRASGYTMDKSVLMNSPYINMVWPFSAGAIESTASDLAKWDQALYTDKILSQSLLDVMWTKTKLGPDKEANYGFGWTVGEVNHIKTESHGGGIPGFTTFIERAPSIGTTVIVLINSDRSDAKAVADHVARFVDPRLAPVVAEAVPDPTPETTRLIRTVIESFLKGKIETTLLSKAMIDAVTPDQLAAMKTTSDQWGKLLKMTLIKAETKDGVQSRSYLLTFEKSKQQGDFVVGKSGLIEDGRLHPL